MISELLTWCCESRIQLQLQGNQLSITGSGSYQAHNYKLESNNFFPVKDITRKHIFFFFDCFDGILLTPICETLGLTYDPYLGDTGAYL